MAKDKPTAPATDAPTTPAAPLPPTLAERVALAVEAERNAEWERIEAKIDEVFGPGLERVRLARPPAGLATVQCDGWGFTTDGYGTLLAYAATASKGETMWRAVHCVRDAASLVPATYTGSRTADEAPAKPSWWRDPAAYLNDLVYRWANGYK